jgi:hypothetical protein
MRPGYLRGSNLGNFWFGDESVREEYFFDPDVVKQKRRMRERRRHQSGAGAARGAGRAPVRQASMIGPWWGTPAHIPWFISQQGLSGFGEERGEYFFDPAVIVQQQRLGARRRYQTEAGAARGARRAPIRGKPVLSPCLNFLVEHAEI